jgi:hypothetical protein
MKRMIFMHVMVYFVNMSFYFFLSLLWKNICYNKCTVSLDRKSAWTKLLKKN